MSAFELREVSVTRGARTVLDRVSLAVEPGEVVALAGPSGSGKTTVLRVLLGLVEPSAGSVELRGAPADAAIEKRGLGMIFQDLALWPHLSARRNVAFRVRDRARVDAALKDVGLEALADRRPGELSGGERQRLAIARALAPEPNALLLDEPLSSLDVDLKREMLRLFARIFRERKLAVLYVSHDPLEARVLADRVVVLEAGRIVQRGTFEELEHAPASRFVRAFVENELVEES